MRKQMDHEEKLLRKDIRKIKGYLSNLEDMKRTLHKATDPELEELIKRDPEVYAAYEEANNIANLSYEEWEEIQLKRENEEKLILSNQGEEHE